MAGVRMDRLQGSYEEGGTFLQLIDMAGRIIEHGEGPLLEEALRQYLARLNPEG
jgi:hypothetical protein